jgi:hypothetical protein
MLQAVLAYVARYKGISNCYVVVKDKFKVIQHLKFLQIQVSIKLLYKITSFPDAYPHNIAALDTFKVEIYKFSA